METWKFRGWDATGQKGWVYGDLIHNQKVTATGLEPRVMVGGYEVVPESVGISLGLPDKNGRMIFDGDIIKDENGVVGYVRYDVYMARFEYGQRNENGSGSGWFWLDYMSRYEVIGNLYENKDIVRIKDGDL